MHFAKTASLIALGSLGLALAGCGTNAHYVDSQGTNTIVSLDQINIQDWANAADQMVASLLVSPALENSPQKPAIMAISRIINNTTAQVDTDYLTKKIRTALLQSGKVVTTTTYGLGGRAEDELAKQTMELQKVQNNDTSSMPLPYYTLSGKLLENRASAGSTRQVTYTFQLTLTQINNGLAVWEDEVNITKQGSRASVGW